MNTLEHTRMKKVSQTSLRIPSGVQYEIFLAASELHHLRSGAAARARAIQWKISVPLCSHRGERVRSHINPDCTNYIPMRECTRERLLCARQFVCVWRRRLFPPANLCLCTSLAAFIQALDLSSIVIPRHKSKCKRGQTYTQTSPSFLSFEGRGCSANIFQMNL